MRDNRVRLAILVALRAGVITACTSSPQPGLDTTLLRARSESIRAQEAYRIEINKATANFGLGAPSRDTGAASRSAH